MGKRADSKALARAERAGVSGAAGPRIDNAPDLTLVTSSKRQTILDGMLEAVGAEGYESTSVRAVLDRTGVCGRPSTITSPTRTSATWRPTTQA